ncbi:MAG: Uncharacterized protein XE10_1535 [Methanoculleus marisnigri]|uniref:Metalloprotease TldD/E C-terminal domain-containing protein n=1 Tax=Methanoculleus marisnigri TaxID=2198 RepID=A0A124G4I2_9EURY|nr:MAG: Uncharacterized protein XE10_1535 [Methanoculleus marisnigri]
MQMGSERDHIITGFNLRDKQDLGRKAGEVAVSLLDAKLAKGGAGRAVLDPELAGVFTHEAVGHASEGDLVREGASVLAGRIGERIGCEGLVIVSRPGGARGTAHRPDEQHLHRKRGCDLRRDPL